MSPVRYVAFLRAVNVGGRNPVPMDGLRRLLEASGCLDPRTILQSGNAVFSRPRCRPAGLERSLGLGLRKWLGHEVGVMVRPLADLRALVEKNPFAGIRVNAHTKLYVAFLGSAPVRRPALPLTSRKEGLEVVAMDGLDVFILSRKVKGRFGFPNELIERELGVRATSRNWNTVKRIVETEPRP